MSARFVAVALMLLSTATAAVAGERAATGNIGSRENLQVFRDIEKQVLGYPHFTIFDSVNTQIEDGVVVLIGKVTMPYKREDLERRVSKVAGVREVHNKLDVLPVSQFDDDLRLRIARAIYSNPNFRPYALIVNPPIHVIVERGHVTLEGVVNSEVDRAIASSIAGFFNAFSVKNNLRTVAEAREELERL